jgi:hypothetical protein
MYASVEWLNIKLWLLLSGYTYIFLYILPFYFGLKLLHLLIQVSITIGVGLLSFKFGLPIVRDSQQKFGLPIVRDSQQLFLQMDVWRFVLQHKPLWVYSRYIFWFVYFGYMFTLEMVYV